MSGLKDIMVRSRRGLVMFFSLSLYSVPAYELRTTYLQLVAAVVSLRYE